MADFEFVTSSAYMFVTGDSDSVNILILSDDEEEVVALAPLDTDADALGIPAFSRNRMFICDLPDSGTATLQVYSLGGFVCHHIYAPVINGNDIDGELIRTRNLLLKGASYPPGA